MEEYLVYLICFICEEQVQAVAVEAGKRCVHGVLADTGQHIYGCWEGFTGKLSAHTDDGTMYLFKPVAAF